MVKEIEPQDPALEEDTSAEDEEQDEPTIEAPSCGVSVREAFASNYLRLIGAPSALVMFYSQSCSHCHETMPHLRQASMFLCNSVKISMACVDIDAIADYAQDTLKITALPTLILFKDNVEIARLEGSQTAKEIVEWTRKFQG